MMRVFELIEILKTYDQDMLVAYDLYSEHCLLEKDHISVMDCCEPRPDGWVANARPDKPAVKYLMFPGN